MTSGTPGRGGPREEAGSGTLPGELERLVAEVLDATGLDLPDRHDVERELRAHFEDGLDAGVPPGELARRFGEPRAAGRRIARARSDRARSRNHEGRGWTMGSIDWIQETRRALRALARAPGWAAVVVVTLALGVGANTAVFTVLDAVLLEDLPYGEPDRLVRLYEVQREDLDGYNYVRGPAFLEYRTWDEVFESAGALYTYRETGADLTEGDVPRRVTVVRVSHDYFETMGVSPALGRTFRPEETTGPGDPEFGAPAYAPVVVLGDALWRDHFQADPDILGRTVVMDDRAFEVIGVMPPGFTDPVGVGAQAWTPLDMRMGGSNSWGNYYLSVVARLRDGIDVEQAQERVAALATRLDALDPGASEWIPRLVPLREDLVGDTRRTMLWILAGAAGLVLLSACVNVANLVLARSLGRSREVAVRAALGSGRGRILAWALTEAGLLAVAGGAAGLVLGWVGTDALLRLAPDALPLVARPELGLRVFAFAFGITLGALLLFGLLPALRVASTPPAGALRQGERGSTGGAAVARLRDLMVVGQVAVGVVLLLGAALLGRSLTGLLDTPLGIDPEGVVTFEVHLPDSRYGTGDQREGFHAALRARLEELPGVEAAGAVSWLPVQGRYNTWGVQYLGREGTQAPDDAWYSSDIRVVSGDYFGALGVEVLRGPGYDQADLAGDSVVWVNQRAAQDLFGGGDPVGERVFVGNAWRRVIGVVEDIAHDPRGESFRKTYIPHAQFAGNRNWALTQTVKTRGDVGALEGRLRQTLASVDPSLVVYRVRPFPDILDSARSRERFATALMGVFAALALLLTLVGVYGVLAGTVASRRREIGIRMALGADQGRVRSLVVRHAALLTVPGLLLGLLGAWAGGRWLQSLLFGVEPGDAVAVVATVLGLGTVALLAGWLPARRATSVDPARTLAE